MPWIQNVSLADVIKGFHFEPGDNAMLIQIVDPDVKFPTPRYNFKEVHQFKFLDIEESDHVWACTQEQANQLAELLKHAMDNRMNVIVHCHAGICRSGAVCELGVMMGFTDPQVFRSPNLLVKHRIMKAIGWTYDEDETHTVNGQTPEIDEWGNPPIILPHNRTQLP